MWSGGGCHRPFIIVRCKMRHKDVMLKLKKSMNITNNDLKRKHLPKMNRYRKKLLYKSFMSHINRYIDTQSKIFYEHSYWGL